MPIVRNGGLYAGYLRAIRHTRVQGGLINVTYLWIFDLRTHVLLTRLKCHVFTSNCIKNVVKLIYRRPWVAGLRCFPSPFWEHLCSMDHSHSIRSLTSTSNIHFGYTTDRWPLQCHAWFVPQVCSLASCMVSKHSSNVQKVPTHSDFIKNAVIFLSDFQKGGKYFFTLKTTITSVPLPMLGWRLRKPFTPSVASQFYV